MKNRHRISSARVASLGWAGLAAAVVCLLQSPVALGYPQYVARTYINCVDCHYSPSGGGLIRSDGAASVHALVPDDLELELVEVARSWVAKNEVTGFDDEGAALHWDVGLELRQMWWLAPQEAGGDVAAVLIPMLIEAGAVLGYGSWLAYATLAPRRLGAGGPPDSAASREHWLMFKLDGSSSLRAGRLVLPYGLRIPNHNQYTRKDLGFDKWHGAYGLELDISHSRWLMSAAMCAGDLSHDPIGLQERGFAASVAYSVPDVASVGGSALGLVTSHYLRTATGLFARVRPWHRLYAMVELSLHQKQQLEGSARHDGTLVYFRAGHFPLESLDIYGEWGGAWVLGAPILTKQSYALGMDWQLLPWLEITLLATREDRAESGRQYGGLAQLHFVY